MTTTTTTTNEFKAARLAAGLTQQKVTDIMRVPLRTVQDWEGDKHIPPAYVRRWYLDELSRLGRCEKP